jgi:hypothetical protein
VSRRTSFHVAAAFSVAVIAVALVVAIIGAKPAQATPDRTTVCTVCHSGTPTGSVTAAPSTTTPAPGAAYTVAIDVNLGGTGKTGYRIANSDAGGATGAWTTVYAGGPNAPSGQTSWTANMTAPATPGTYYYKVFGVKGYAGSASTATYSITVADTPAADVTAPTTTATGAVDNRWYKGAVTVNLTATDNAGGSGVASITYAVDGTPTTVNASTAQAQVPAIDGPHTVTYFATDVATNAETLHTLTVNVDTTSPVTALLANVTAKKGAKATIKYQVTDPAPNGGTAVTTVKIKNKAGKVVKTLKSTAKPVNAAQNVKFVCKLAKGTYKITATARDKAGNVSTVSPAKRLTVK